jgi:SulP family sulfate permease
MSQVLQLPGRLRYANPPVTDGGLIFRLVPSLDSLRRYSAWRFRRDLVAGLTVASVAVPQAMAYAMVAGLPPQYGLYTAIVTTAVGALFDSSRLLINGPTNALAITLLSILGPFPDAEKVPAAILLAFLVGGIQTAIALLRLGGWTRYISPGVITGFVVGAGILLLCDQLRNLQGLPSQGGPGDHFLKRFWLTQTQTAPVNPWAVAIGVGTVALLLALRGLNAVIRFRLPEFLGALAGAALLAWALDLEAKHVPLVGALPAALPEFAWPVFDLSSMGLLARGALALALLGLLEAIAMAQALAVQTGQPLDCNQQCLSEGLANLAGSFFHCIPGSGSLTRSAINQQAGGKRSGPA